MCGCSHGGKMDMIFKVIEHFYDINHCENATERNVRNLSFQAAIIVPKKNKNMIETSGTVFWTLKKDLLFSFNHNSDCMYEYLCVPLAPVSPLSP